jgi:hypothetical protein
LIYEANARLGLAAYSSEEEKESTRIVVTRDSRGGVSISSMQTWMQLHIHQNAINNSSAYSVATESCHEDIAL